MSTKAKFDQESAFKSIIGVGRESSTDKEVTRENQTREPKKRATMNGEKQDRIQRSYFLDKDVDKALKRKSLEEEKTLTEAINEALREGLNSYL